MRQKPVVLEWFALNVLHGSAWASLSAALAEPKAQC